MQLVGDTKNHYFRIRIGPGTKHLVLQGPVRLTDWTKFVLIRQKGSSLDGAHLDKVKISTTFFAQPVTRLGTDHARRFLS